MKNKPSQNKQPSSNKPSPLEKKVLDNAKRPREDGTSYRSVKKGK